MRNKTLTKSFFFSPGNFHEPRLNKTNVKCKVKYFGLCTFQFTPYTSFVNFTSPADWHPPWVNKFVTLASLLFITTYTIFAIVNKHTLVKSS